MACLCLLVRYRVAANLISAVLWPRRQSGVGPRRHLSSGFRRKMKIRCPLCSRSPIRKTLLAAMKGPLHSGRSRATVGLLDGSRRTSWLWAQSTAVPDIPEGYILVGLLLARFSAFLEVLAMTLGRIWKRGCRSVANALKLRQEMALFVKYHVVFFDFSNSDRQNLVFV